MLSLTKLFVYNYFKFLIHWFSFTRYRVEGCTSRLRFSNFTIWAKPFSVCPLHKKQLYSLGALLSSYVVLGGFCRRRKFSRASQNVWKTVIIHSPPQSSKSVILQVPPHLSFVPTGAVFFLLQAITQRGQWRESRNCKWKVLLKLLLSLYLVLFIYFFPYMRTNQLISSWEFYLLILVSHMIES